MTPDSPVGWSAAAGALATALTDPDYKAALIRGLTAIDTTALSDAVVVYLGTLFLIVILGACCIGGYHALFGPQDRDGNDNQRREPQ